MARVHCDKCLFCMPVSVYHLVGSFEENVKILNEEHMFPCLSFHLFIVKCLLGYACTGSALLIGACRFVINLKRNNNNIQINASSNITYLVFLHDMM